MPLFTSSSGLQINGGTFLDIAGDLNIQNIPLPVQETEGLPFEFGSDGRELLSVERTDRRDGHRQTPYGEYRVSCRNTGSYIRRWFSPVADSDFI
jgi:hypothetical protein